VTFEDYRPAIGYRVRFARGIKTGIGEDSYRSVDPQSDVFVYPNPFSVQATFRYRIPRRSKASLRVYDSSGRLVKTLEDGNRPVGSYSATWDGRDKSGERLPSGIYFCRLQAGDATATRKMILLK
jgi:flagellar hook assembly protein FlgD